MMRFQHAHSLPKDEARQRVECLTRYWQDEHGVAVTWNGDSARLSGTVKGIHFEAQLTVRDRVVDGEGPDPGFLVRAAATAYLKRMLGEYLDPKRSLASLTGASA